MGDKILEERLDSEGLRMRSHKGSQARATGTKEGTIVAHNVRVAR